MKSYVLTMRIQTMFMIEDFRAGGRSGILAQQLANVFVRRRSLRAPTRRHTHAAIQKPPDASKI